ncbi:MAG TPA: sulfite exporter TauE/SafE family protein [Vicinamibacterales bacterium]|nr:sulfite exporter TauE/SafE family protein [Vicinamibacterales bacterium]
MLTALLGLQISLSAFTLYYLGVWWTGAQKSTSSPSAPPEARAGGFPNPIQLLIGFVTNFFDTLGIGSFAPTTAVFKFFKIVSDRLIPGTLNVGHTLPTITQAFIYTTIIEIDMTTLILMIGAAVSGSWLGAGIVAGWPKRNIQIGMGLALLVAAGLFTWRNLGGEGTVVGTLDLTGVKLALGLLGNFALGALMSLGIGMYAPCMILVGLLGMKASAAFPIMMGSCAFLMPVASARFVQKQAYAFKPAVGLALGGIPAVLIAALIVKELDVTTMRWLVVVVVTIAATMMLRSAAKGE